MSKQRVHRPYSTFSPGDLHVPQLVGLSGAKDISGHPGLLDAVGALRRGDVLLIAKRDRLGRDVVAVTLIERLIARKGARVACSRRLRPEAYRLRHTSSKSYVSEVPHPHRERQRRGMRFRQVKAHDARIVAAMNIYGIRRIVIQCRRFRALQWHLNRDAYLALAQLDRYSPSLVACEHSWTTGVRSSKDVKRSLQMADIDGKLFINGQWRDGAARLPVVNPATEETLCLLATVAVTAPG